jgi:broad specificity phosphatase PhoE
MFYLIRHGTNDVLPRALAARLPGVHLNDEGRGEARRVADRLKNAPIRHLFSSPMERCVETAEPLAAALNLKLEISEPLNEVDFGDWKGAEMKVLAADERWKQWNAFRTGHVLPNGETMIQIQCRIATEMIRLKSTFPNEHIALFSHGDPIRAALCYWLGMPLDFLPRLQVDTGSINIVRVDHATAIVQAINSFADFRA